MAYEDRFPIGTRVEAGGRTGTVIPFREYQELYKALDLIDTFVYILDDEDGMAGGWLPENVKLLHYTQCAECGVNVSTKDYLCISCRAIL